MQSALGRSVPRETKKLRPGNSLLLEANSVLISAQGISPGQVKKATNFTGRSKSKRRPNAGKIPASRELVSMGVRRRGVHRRERWRPGGAATKAAPKGELGSRRQVCRGVEFIDENGGGPGVRLQNASDKKVSPRSLQPTVSDDQQVTIAGEAYRLIHYFQD